MYGCNVITITIITTILNKRLLKHIQDKNRNLLQ